MSATVEEKQHLVINGDINKPSSILIFILKVLLYMYILLKDAKNHLNIDESFTADDKYIISLIQVAEDAIEKRIDKKLSECVNPLTGYIDKSVEQSILLLIGQFYANREATTTVSVNEIPIGFNFLADLNKHYFIP